MGNNIDVYLSQIYSVIKLNARFLIKMPEYVENSDNNSGPRQTTRGSHQATVADGPRALRARFWWYRLLVVEKPKVSRGRRQKQVYLIGYRIGRKNSLRSLLSYPQMKNNTVVSGTKVGFIVTYDHSLDLCATSCNSPSSAQQGVLSRKVNDAIKSLERWVSRGEVDLPAERQDQLKEGPWAVV